MGFLFHSEDTRNTLICAFYKKPQKMPMKRLATIYMLLFIDFVTFILFILISFSYNGFCVYQLEEVF